MISPIVGAGLSIAAPLAGRQAMQLVDQATATFAQLLGAAADTLQSNTQGAPSSEPTTAASSSGSSVSIESIRTLGKHLAADFHRRAMTQLEDAGIDTTIDFSLRLGSQGEVIVMGDHPDKQLIEQILNSSDLGELFGQLSGLYEISNAYDEQSSFREAFARNPVAAVADYTQSSHDRLAGVLQLTLNDEGVSVDFPAW
jgi:hypothetical protein